MDQHETTNAARAYAARFATAGLLAATTLAALVCGITQAIYA